MAFGGRLDRQPGREIRERNEHQLNGYLLSKLYLVKKTREDLEKAGELAQIKINIYFHTPESIV